jgi:hypothetical protein
MGYTHYWTHRKSFTAAEWQTIKTDVTRILETAERAGIRFGTYDGSGAVTLPTIDRDENGEHLAFNGLGDDRAETFWINKDRAPREPWQEASRRGWTFCKTNRQPYDEAVTAALVYLESVYPAKIDAGSDGDAEDWEAGLGLAREALPHLSDVLRIPKEIALEA